MDGAEPPVTAWVLEAPTNRALRAAARAEGEPVPLGPTTFCVPLAGGPSEVVRRRVERRLGAPVEARANCDVAWYPVGRGYVALVVGAPADGLEEALDAWSPAYREVNRPLDPAARVRVCLPAGAVADPLALGADLRAQGYTVFGTWAVGACRRT
jgi:hypothetical protein